MTGNKHPKGFGKTLFLSLTSLGVVFGDIGTSPLYAINQIFFGNIFSSEMIRDVLGPISLVIWALTIVVAFKYVIFVLSADDDGEGGVFALYALLNRLRKKNVQWLMLLLIIGAGLLFGDGVITPAISVLSAVEGLKIATHAFSKAIVPITLIFVTVLFLLQRTGTKKVGVIFGPIITLWFILIGVIGFNQIMLNPHILQALNPMYALRFFLNHQVLAIMLTLGSVILVLTGGEAMYADMGHFGSFPIRLSWFLIVFPALILNYLGQGAYLLSGQRVIENNIFFSMIPEWGLYPMVILAMLSTIIASQALISGGFSLAQQAISLGLFPWLKVIHTNHEQRGQVYVPFINKVMYVGCVLLVLFFQTSGRLGGLYGVAVSWVMLITSLSMIYIARYYWKWDLRKTLFLFIPLTVINIVFVISCFYKFVHGGYISLLIGLAILIIMTTWQWGRKKIFKAYQAYPRMSVKELVEIKKQGNIFFPRSELLMSNQVIENIDDKIPLVGQLFWERYGELPMHIVFVTAIFQKEPYIHENRYEINKFYDNPEHGSVLSVKINFGFREDPNVEKALEGLVHHKKIHIDEDYTKWNITVLHERVSLDDEVNLFTKLRFHLFKILRQNASKADHYLSLGRKHQLSIEVEPVILS